MGIDVGIVLCPGSGDPPSVWDATVSHLPREVSIFAYQYEACAQSGRTFEELAAQLDRWLRIRSFAERCVLVGHSFGGGVAATFAARYARRVRAVLLLDATPPRFMEDVLRVIPAGATGVASDLRSEAESALDWRRNPAGLDGRTAYRQLADLHSLDDGIHLQVLSHDEIFFTELVPAYGPELERLWHRGQLHWANLVTETRVEAVAGSGHYIHRDAPGLVAERLLECLEPRMSADG